MATALTTSWLQGWCCPGRKAPSHLGKPRAAASLPSLFWIVLDVVSFVPCASVSGAVFTEVPVISVRATQAETREPFCDPAICDAALPPPGVFRLSRRGNVTHELAVRLRYSGSALNGIDFDPLSEVVLIPAGHGSVEILIAAHFDELAEGDETVIAEVQPDPSAGPVARYEVDPHQSAALVVIRDNELPSQVPWISLERVESEAMETLAFQSAIFWGSYRVWRTGDPAGELVVFLNTREGSARFAEDYWLERVSAGRSIRFLPGERSVTVRLFPIDDDMYEGAETAFAHLIAAPAATPLAAQYEVNHVNSSVSIVIRDNDPVTTRLALSMPRNGQRFEPGEPIPLRAEIIGPGSQESWLIEFLEGEHLIGTAPSGSPVWWREANGGPHLIGARALSSAGSLLAARPIAISVGTGAALPVVSVSASGNKTMEPCVTCFAPPAYFVVARTGSTHEALTVHLEFDGTAVAGQDYIALPGQVTIPAGTNSVRLLVLARDDPFGEGPEIVRAKLVASDLLTGGYLSGAFAQEAMVVIADDEADAPGLRLDIAEPLPEARAGTRIQISAFAVWTQGEVDRPVEFFADNTFIGQSEPPLLGRPPIPCLPSVHTIFWTNPPPGAHVLRAVFRPGQDIAVTSPPVAIHIESAPSTRVWIETTQAIAEETAAPLDREPWRGMWTVTRSGPTNDPLVVYMLYTGSAEAGVDYGLLPGQVIIPAGAVSTTLEVQALSDGLDESIERVVAHISQCPPPWLDPPCYDFAPDPARAQAAVFIRDDGRTRASLVITRPRDGERFDVGETIVVEATAVSLDDDLNWVSLWETSVEQQIGFSEAGLASRPPQGAPVHHIFALAGAASGHHTLQARVIGQEGFFDVLRSNPVRLIVGTSDNQAPEVSIVRPAGGTEVPAGPDLEIVAEARDPDGHVRRIEFYADDRKIGEAGTDLSHPPSVGHLQSFAIIWRHPPAGPHTLAARAVDDHGATTTSVPVKVFVAEPAGLPVVTVTAPDSFAAEPRGGEPDQATFVVHRSGSAEVALRVKYSLRGTAINGIDYSFLSGDVVVPAGQMSVSLFVRPVPDDLTEPIETVLLWLEPPAESAASVDAKSGLYRVGRPSVAGAVIADDRWPLHSGQAQCRVLPGNLAHLAFVVDPGRNYRLEAGSDFRHWETLVEMASPDGMWLYVDSDPGSHPCRFYRLVPAP